MSVGTAINTPNSPSLYLRAHEGADTESGYSYTLGVDSDANGTIDSERPISEEELAAILAPMGLRMVGGSLVSIDGFEVNAANDIVLNGGDSDPVVGAPAGDRASVDDLRQSVSGLEGEGCIAWMVISEMARTAEKERKTARELRDALQKGKFEEKRNSIDASAAKIEAEKNAAWVQFGASCAAAAVSLGGGAYGIRGGNAAMSQAIVASSSVINTGATAIDKNFGFQAEADAQELRSKHHDLEADQLDMYIDDASSNYQESKQAHDKAIKLLEDFMQRKTDSLNAILRS